MNGQEPSQETKRMLELLCNIARGLTALADKLDNIAVLTQQEVDLLRRLIKERAL